MGKGKSKKNKQYGYDIVDNDEQAEVTLQDFVIPAKIEAFCSQYKPLDHWVDGCEVFNDARLREYFKEIVCQLGDPLSLYLQKMSNQGYRKEKEERSEHVTHCRAK